MGLVFTSIVHPPEELACRLAAEAAGLGMTVDELAAEALEARFLPTYATPAAQDALQVFTGSGDCRYHTWAARPSG